MSPNGGSLLVSFRWTPFLLALTAALGAIAQEPGRSGTGENKLPVPDAAARKAAEKEVKEVFKDEYAKHTPADRAALARKMVDLAAQSNDTPSIRYVLLREARDIYASLGAWTLAAQAIDAMADGFAIDLVATRTTALDTASGAAKTPEEIRPLVAAYLELSDLAITRDDADGADRAVGSALSLAKRAKDISLVSRAEAKAKECAQHRKELEGLRKAQEALAAHPGDAGSSTVVGRHECFVKENWSQGLAFLAKGNEPILRALAERDLAASSDPALALAVGHGWWDQADHETGPIREHLRRRAAFWYEKAYPDSTGLTKARLERRLEDTGRSRDVWAWIRLRDPRLFGLKGKIEEDRLEITLNPTGDEGAPIKMETFPPGVFDTFTVRVRPPAKGNMQAMVIFEAPGKPNGYALFVERRVTSAVDVISLATKDFPPVLRKPIKDQETYLLSVAIRGTQYVVSLDDQELVRFPTTVDHLQYLVLQARWGSITFDDPRLRHKTLTPEPPRDTSITLQAFIDGESTLHVSPTRIFWESGNVAKPGRHNGANEPTLVNSKPWMPKWGKPQEDRGQDVTEALPLDVGPVENLKLELLAVGTSREATGIEPRDPIETRVMNGEFLITIPDRQEGPRWYKFRLYR